MGQPALKIEPDYQVRVPKGLFNKIYVPFVADDYNNSKSTEIFYGGSSSGKSNFVAHRTILDLMRGGHNYLCIRKRSNSITKSVANELTKAITAMGARGLFHIVQGLITCINGYQILFSGMDDPEKIKSITPAKGVITDVWYEEATEAAPDDIKQLRKRLRGFAKYLGQEVKKRITLTFNPIYRTHWLYVKYFGANNWADDQKFHEDKKLRILKTTYKDNRFLTEQDKEELEDEDNEYWYEVYTLGNWGVLGDSILTNWESKDLTELIPTFDRIRNGLDFGYSGHPNSFVRLHIDMKKKIIYVFKGWEEKGLTNTKIATELKKSGVGDEIVFCDSAEPKSIQELVDDGINARGAKKGPDSVLNGLKWLKGFLIIVHHTLQHIINELTIYSWKKDKFGDSLPIPEDKNDHSIDAIRYGTESDHGGYFADVT